MKSFLKLDNGTLDAEKIVCILHASQLKDPSNPESEKMHMVRVDLDNGHSIPILAHSEESKLFAYDHLTQYWMDMPEGITELETFIMKNPNPPTEATPTPNTEEQA
jgi:hypothetical protein